MADIVTTASAVPVKPLLFDIVHMTHYSYAQPVQLGEHRVMFRPRGSHDLRVLATDLQVVPEPMDVRLVQDVYSNSIAIVQPRSPASELKIISSFTVEHAGSRALDLPLNPEAETYPFDYSPEERFSLRPYLIPFYTDPTQQLRDWAMQFVDAGGVGRTVDVLVAMNQFIRNAMLYLVRFDEGVQTPYETLSLGSGTCRDFATLMIEALRLLGFAARFVSGYLYSPALDDLSGSCVGVGATHAWVQVFLPGAGWIPFDPTNNLIGGTDLIRVCVARHASFASPVSGTWTGFPGDYLGMQVNVQVHRRPQ